MIILSVSLSVFWFVFPSFICLNKYHKLTIQITGIGGMTSSFLLLTHLNHDLAINISSGISLIAMIGTIVAVYKHSWHNLFLFGLFNFLLIGSNNYLYYSEGMIMYLPLVQKITFISVLVWICLISRNTSIGVSLTKSHTT